MIAKEHQLLVTTNKLLRERKYGRFEGRDYREYRQEMKHLLDQKEQLSRVEQYKFKLAKDIESDEEIVNRLILFLRETALVYMGQTIAAVTHGGTMINFLDHVGYLEKSKYWIDNLAYAVIQTDGIDFHVTQTDGFVEANHD